jgi:uncharacterized protein YjbI with pentapeptide repeats
MLRALEILRSHGSVDRQAELDLVAADDKSLCGISLGGFDLSGLRLTHLSIGETDFRGSVCEATRFPPLHKCRLDGVVARRSWLPQLHDCSLIATDLSSAELGYRIQRSNFAHCVLDFARTMEGLEEHSDAFHGNSFESASMRAFDAAGARLAGTRFDGAMLSGARLSRTTLTSCDFSNADLAGANLCGAYLKRSRFDGAKLLGMWIVPESSAASLINSPDACLVQSNPSLTSLHRSLAGVREFTVECTFRHASTGKSEDLVISNRDGLRATAFVGGTSRFLRMYPLQGQRTLEWIITALAFDFVDWSPTMNRIATVPESSMEAVSQAFRSVLRG